MCLMCCFLFSVLLITVLIGLLWSFFIHVGPAMLTYGVSATHLENVNNLERLCFMGCKRSDVWWLRASLCVVVCVRQFIRACVCVRSCSLSQSSSIILFCFDSLKRQKVPERLRGTLNYSVCVRVRDDSLRSVIISRLIDGGTGTFVFLWCFWGLLSNLVFSGSFGHAP